MILALKASRVPWIAGRNHALIDNGCGVPHLAPAHRCCSTRSAARDFVGNTIPDARHMVAAQPPSIKMVAKLTHVIARLRNLSDPQIVIAICGATAMECQQSSLKHQAADALRRARKLPVGSDRNDLRQLAVVLLWLHRHGMEAFQERRTRNAANFSPTIQEMRE